MAPEEGALLLLRRAGVIAKDALFAEADKTNCRFALQLSREMGGLPLALDQAGAFIEETHRSLSEYAEIYASGRGVRGRPLKRLCHCTAIEAIPSPH